MCCCILITLLLKWIVTVFKFPPGYHNVYLLPTQVAYTSCDQSKATELNDGKTGSYFVSIHN
jgi:hypothetical protein